LNTLLLRLLSALSCLTNLAAAFSFWTWTIIIWVLLFLNLDDAIGILATLEQFQGSADIILIPLLKREEGDCKKLILF
jgi:hypothetical protein